MHHAAFPFNEIPAFFKTLHSRDAIKTTQLAFEFLILTATLTNEVINTTWSEINLKSKTWTIPGSRMKTNREHLITLSRRSIEKNETGYYFTWF